MPIAAPRPESWVRAVPGGLYCEPGDFFIDPTQAVDRAVITHGHGDHARPNNRHVLATEGTIAIMQSRFVLWACVQPSAAKNIMPPSALWLPSQ